MRLAQKQDIHLSTPHAQIYSNTWIIHHTANIRIQHILKCAPGVDTNIPNGNVTFKPKRAREILYRNQ